MSLWNGLNVWVTKGDSFMFNLAKDIGNNLLYGISGQSLVVFGATNGTILANKSWTDFIPTDSPVLYQNGVILSGVTSINGGSQSTIISLTYNHLSGEISVLWTQNLTSGQNIKAVSVLNQTRVYTLVSAPNLNSSIAALDLANGSVYWELSIPNKASTIRIRPNGEILVSNKTSTMALHEFGNKFWYGHYWDYVAIAIEGNTVYGFDSRWQGIVTTSTFSHSTWITDCMTLGGISVGKNISYATCNGRFDTKPYLLAFTKDKLIWKFKMNDMGMHTPIPAGDTLFITSQTNLYRFGCCAGNGICSPGGCQCDTNYYSSNCSRYCNPNTCQAEMGGHGMCSGYGYCVCQSGFYGYNCTVPCNSINCQNGGYCADDGQCFCRQYYGGTNCSVYCESGGNINNDTCQCKTDYYGNGCQTFCQCDHGKCDSEGTCVCETSDSILGTGRYYGKKCTDQRTPVGVILIVFAVIAVVVMGVAGGIYIWKKKKQPDYWELSQDM